MAQCKETAKEFIEDVFSPMVAVLCSAEVETVCQKNGLSFVELIQPFCRLTSEAHIRDPNNVSHPVRNLHIVVHDMNAHLPQNILAKKLLNDVVSNSLPQHSADIMQNNVVTVNNHDLQLDATTPWFEAYRSAFLQIAYPSDHEFLRHYLACIFVVSSSNADPIEQFVKLTHQQSVQQNQQPHKLPKWFMPNILRYYVLVHDVTEQEEAKAETIYQNLKAKYGVLSCHLLHINSRLPASTTSGPSDSVNMPNPWSRFIAQKQEMSESAEFESFMRPGDEENDEFPAHVNEGSLQSVSTDVDLALEATEYESSTSSSQVICHPLGPDSEVLYDPLTSDTDSAVSISSQFTANHAGNRPSADSSGLRCGGRSVPLGVCLTLSDHERLRIFINEFIVKGLISWAEKSIRTLNDQLTTRKGLHRSLFSATKKWFGGSRQTNPAIITNSTNVVYTLDAPEMQMRRLADLAFMFQLYELSYQIYHSAKKDFNNDHAWLHYAGAMEMACLSIFMQDSTNQRQYPLHYMETTITTYLAACKVPHFATRATLLSTEVLKAKGLFAEAAMQFIKMTSEESDLRSALLLEQAAHCFVKMKPPMVRKYAFHMILAGHRFNKSGQKRHALRSYAQALQVYKGRYWSMAEDHINYTIGCQSFNLKQFDVATSALKHLLSANSQQSLPQQTAFLREYLSVFKQLASQAPDDEERELPELPLPIVESNAIKILCASNAELIQQDCLGLRIQATGVSFNTTDAENVRFARLEELIVSSISGPPPSSSAMSFKPTIQCFTRTSNNTASPVIAVEEPVTIEVTVINQLKVTLVLRDIRLLWRFTPDECDNAEKAFYSNEQSSNTPKVDENVIVSTPLSEILLEGSETKRICISLIIRMMGQLQITGLAYNIGCMSTSGQLLTSAVPDSVSLALGSNSVSAVLPPFSGANSSSLSSPILVSGKVHLEVQGPRLNSTKDERLGKMYGPDKRLNLIITDKMPKLEVFFRDFPASLFTGQICQASVELVNAGHRPLHNVIVATSNPEFLTFGSSSRKPETSEKQADDVGYSSDVIRRHDVTLVTKLDVTSPLDPGASVVVPMWIRSPDVPGDHVIDFLFYYEPAEAVPHCRHRVLRHTAQLTVYPSLNIRAICGRMVNTGAADQAEDIYRSTNSVFVSLEVENICNVPSAPSLCAVQTLCLSEDWMIKEINSSALKQDVSIGVQECQLFTLKAVKCLHNSDKSSSNALKLSTVSCASIASKTNIPKYISIDFFFRANLGESSKSSRLAPSSFPIFSNLSSANGAESSLAGKLEKSFIFDLNLIIQWQAAKTDGNGATDAIVGQHHLTLNQLHTLITSPLQAKLPTDLPPIRFTSSHSPMLLLEPSSELLSQLVRFSFCYQCEAVHDFSQKRLCIVPVTVHLYNCTSVPVYVDIDTQAGHGRSTVSSSRNQHLQPYNPLFQGHPTRSFTWSGLTVTRIHLLPYCGQSICLKACFVASGVYDLGTLQVLAFPAGDGDGISIQPTVQRLLSPALMTVHSRS